MAGLNLTSPSVPLAYKLFNGGLNSTSSPLGLKDNETPDCQNVDFDRFGSVLKRNGYTAVNTSAFNSGAAWNSLYWYQTASGVDYLLGTCGNKLAYWDGASLSGSPTDITGSLTITAGADNFVDWDTFLDTALGTNGVDVPFQWNASGNGSAMAVPSGLTKAKFVKVFQSYVFLANVTVSGTIHPSRVYFSNINSITTWTAADNYDISRNDGQEITGLRVLSDRLCVFKNDSIWLGLFTGDADIPFVFRKSNSPVGCDSHWSIQEADNGLIFHSQDGFYFFDGMNSFKLSDRIRTTLTGFGQNRFTQIASCYQHEKNRYYSTFTTSGGTTHNRIVTFDTANNAFGLYTGMAANCMTMAHPSGQERVYFGDYSGFVYRMDTGTDDYPLNVQTAINAYYYTKWFDFDDLVTEKRIPIVVLYYDINSATLSVAYSYDLSTSDDYSLTFSTSGGGSLWDTGLWDTATFGTAGGSIRRVDLIGRGRLVRVKFSNSTLAETFKINAMGKLVNMETEV